MVEGDRVAPERRSRPRPGEQVRPQMDPGKARGRLRSGREIRHEDGRLQGGDLTPDLRDRVPAIVRAAVVAIPVDGEEHPRLDLPEPVHDAPDAELGRAARPDRAEAGGREEG